MCLRRGVDTGGVVDKESGVVLVDYRLVRGGGEVVTPILTSDDG